MNTRSLLPLALTLALTACSPLPPPAADSAAPSPDTASDSASRDSLSPTDSAPPTDSYSPADAAAPRPADAATPAADATADASPTTPPTPTPREPDGRFGVPTRTFVIPVASPAAGLYVADVQAAYPDVDFDTLDRLYIPAGHYKFIRLGNLPARTAARPLVITNHGGQVRVGGLGHHYVFSLGGGANWVLTGRYDPVSRTGDVQFPGHRGGAYANTRGRYGFLVDDAFEDENSGVQVNSRATDFELEYLEVTRVGFAGVMLKTDSTPDALMANVRFHDNYIHDVGSEGVYFGSTQSGGQHKFRGLQFYNNRVIRTGTEALQLGQIGEGCEVHHNVFALGAIGWRSAFQRYQDSCAQYAAREGSSSVHHNVFIGAANTLLSFLGQSRDGDVHRAGDTVTVRANYYSHTRFLGAYVSAESDGVTAYRFEDNWLRAIGFSYAEVYPSTAEPDHVFRIANTRSPITLANNRWDGARALTDRTDMPEGTFGNVTLRGNTNGAVAPIAFNDFGFAPEFDYSRVELWTERATLRADMAAVYYERGDWVTHDGELYEYTGAARTTGMRPDLHPELWARRATPDDVRLRAGSPYAGVGLLDTVD